MSLPPIQRKKYNEDIGGVYGEFGSGANLQAIYLQSALPPSHLEKISLISDIRGSERWSVRDLFQREVDDARVTHGLMPYLSSPEKIKFFNPLTLTALPMDRSGGKILSQMQRVVEHSVEENGTTWNVLERDGFYRLKWVDDSPEYAKFEWNNVRSRIVAIDGQHRLSALKRLWALRAREGQDEPFGGWRIPVVLVTFRAVGGREEPPSVLEVVRSIFVYINTEAHQVSETRQILLSDESVNAVATQELLQLAHENDLLYPGERQPKTVPLLFYDWRGLERDKKPVKAAAALKTVREVRDWFAEYILGEDFHGDQKVALDIRPVDRLYRFYADGAAGQEGSGPSSSLDYDSSRHLRAKLRESVLPAVSHLLEQFAPYGRYIAELRRLEERYRRGSDLEQHAFEFLRFGSSYAIDATAPEVERLEAGIVQEITDLREQCLPVLIRHEIGMRGVVQAFGGLIYHFGYPDWGQYGRWFTACLNLLYAGGWLDVAPGAKGSEHLLHVVRDHNDTIVNYRLGQAEAALGAYLSLLVGSYGAPVPAEWQADWPSVRGALLDWLESTITRGYKKQVRPQLKEKYPNGGRELTAAVNAEASRLAGRHMRRFERELERIAAAAERRVGEEVG